MNKTAAHVLVVTLVIFAGNTVNAAQPQGKGWLGAGGHSCAAFLGALREHPANGEGYRSNGTTFLSVGDVYQQWLWGYVSAATFRFDLPAGAEITQWAAHWCENHPYESFASAAVNYVAQLKDRKRSVR